MGSSSGRRAMRWHSSAASCLARSDSGTWSASASRSPFRVSRMQPVMMRAHLCCSASSLSRADGAACTPYTAAP